MTGHELSIDRDAAPTLTATEQAVAAIWHEVLELSRPLTATDNFFAAGGDSMTMVLLEFRLKEEFSVDLPPGIVLSAPTLVELSCAVNSALAR